MKLITYETSLASLAGPISDRVVKPVALFGKDKELLVKNVPRNYEILLLTLFQHQQHNQVELVHQENVFYFEWPKQPKLNLP